MSIEHSGIIEENQTGFLFEEAQYLDNDLHPDLLEFFNKNRANNASTLNPQKSINPGNREMLKVRSLKKLLGML